LSPPGAPQASRTTARSSLPYDDQRLDPGLERLTGTAAPPHNIHWNLVVALPVGFTFALGLLLLAFGAAHLREAIAFLVAGGLGLAGVRYLDQHS
ncbi:MAG TPA: hypothetical protein PLI31_09285, partial [Methanoregulaceae archaeon]|nr:hypothetical protein [Methanoregulaceae archaeon]